MEIHSFEFFLLLLAAVGTWVNSFLMLQPTITRKTKTHPMPWTRYYETLFTDDPADSPKFGRQEYWNTVYKKESNFSWYAEWEDLKPFVTEFIPSCQSSILLPGVGNDAVLIDMYKDGYTNLTAMDYAPEAIERCEDMFQTEDDGNKPTIEFRVADARDLQGWDSCYFGGIMEKGTLDAIYLSGGKNKTLATENLQFAFSELTRCLKPGGIWMSIAGVVDQEIQELFESKNEEWTCLVGYGELYITQDGYTSNNIDGSLLVFEKNKELKDDKMTDKFNRRKKGILMSI